MPSDTPHHAGRSGQPRPPPAAIPSVANRPLWALRRRALLPFRSRGKPPRASAVDGDDGEVVTEHELIARVDAAFAVTGRGLAGWPDPHPDRSLVRDEEYSRSSNPAKWRIVGARADAWLMALHETGLAVVYPGAQVQWRVPPKTVVSRTDRIVPRVAGALPLVVARSQLGAVDDAGVTLGVGDPAVCAVWIPDCGCDACDSGSQDVLDELDEHVFGVVSGAFRRLWSGDRGGLRHQPARRGVRGRVGRRGSVVVRSMRSWPSLWAGTRCPAPPGPPTSDPDGVVGPTVRGAPALGFHRSRMVPTGSPTSRPPSCRRPGRTPPGALLGGDVDGRAHRGHDGEEAQGRGAEAEADVDHGCRRGSAPAPPHGSRTREARQLVDERRGRGVEHAPDRLPPSPVEQPRPPPRSSCDRPARARARRTSARRSAVRGGARVGEPTEQVAGAGVRAHDVPAVVQDDGREGLVMVEHRRRRGVDPLEPGVERPARYCGASPAASSRPLRSRSGTSRA